MTIQNGGYEKFLYDNKVNEKYQFVIGLPESSKSLLPLIENKRAKSSGQRYRKFYFLQFKFLFFQAFRTLLNVIIGRSDLKNAIRYKKPL